MEEYQATTQYFYSIVLKNNQIELLHTSIGNNISHEKEESFSNVDPVSRTINKKVLKFE